MSLVRIMTSKIVHSQREFQACILLKIIIYLLIHWSHQTGFKSANVVQHSWTESNKCQIYKWGMLLKTWLLEKNESTRMYRDQLCKSDSKHPEYLQNMGSQPILFSSHRSTEKWFSSLLSYQVTTLGKQLKICSLTMSYYKLKWWLKRSFLWVNFYCLPV